jgi:hypothetical protein
MSVCNQANMKGSIVRLRKGILDRVYLRSWKTKDLAENDLFKQALYFVDIILLHTVTYHSKRQKYLSLIGNDGSQ